MDPTFASVSETINEGNAKTTTPKKLNCMKKNIYVMYIRCNDTLLLYLDIVKPKSMKCENDFQCYFINLRAKETIILLRYILFLVIFLTKSELFSKLMHVL